MLKGIDNVGIAVTDLKRSIAFYEKLGFIKGQDYEAGVTGCTMTAESAVLFLFQTRQPDPQTVKREPTLAQNPPGLDHSITAIKRLIDEGCLERLLLSHDTGMKIQLTRYGGWGYAHLLKNVVPMLQRRGFGESEITTLLVENPQRVLTWGTPAE